MSRSMSPFIVASVVFAVAVMLLIPGGQSLTRETFICRDPDCGRNVSQLISSKGYPVVEYTVQTPDGYLLGVQRIPHGLNNANSTKVRPAVLLQHGLLDASHTWVINFPYESLGFILADAGYDVWLGNNRGNVYSKNHVSLSPKSEAFWKFSWDEMGQYDLPSMIDFILSATSQSQLIHIGHSEGTMQGFAAYQNATVAAKVKLFVALAPVAYIGDIESKFLRALAEFDVAGILDIFGVKQFLPSAPIVHDIGEIACDVSDKVCNNVMCVIAGCDPNNLNQSRWDVYMSADPAGTSVQNMLHFQQGVNHDNWCKEDFGYFGNKQKYGHHNYPCYDLNEVQVPMALFTGGQDKLADPSDVSKLVKQLNPKYVVSQYNIDYYEHMDFIWGMDAYKALYPQVMTVMQQFSPV